LIHHPFRTSVRSDKIGKVFRVLDLDMRRCLICDRVFTRQPLALLSAIQDGSGSEIKILKLGPRWD